MITSLLFVIMEIPLEPLKKYENPKVPKLRHRTTCTHHFGWTRSCHEQETSY